ncbi:hypothetical protein LTR09_005823 [Extremus antarcticus]|uniref:Uncharacterized protein n=1 Tax=Extremus antarcticus TaxID=702011 RepID=A0AAJ0DFR2_9PEZI|nr:hypothetical protein LTR09_005823 [Extremus antarcticus]
MARLRWRQAVPLLALLLALPLSTHAQLSGVPNLSTATQTTATSGETTAQTTQQTTARTTTQDGRSTDSTLALTNAPDLTTTSTSRQGLAAPTVTNTDAAIHLTGIPTIAGAGIPTLVIPWTAGAPFMQQSSLPQGTFFIAVGATLAFLGACVILWRLMVAWSVNRSVKRTAMLASMGGPSEKGGRTTSSYWGGSSGGGYNRMASSAGPGGKGGYYKDSAYESTVSLDNLTSAGKPMKPHFRDSAIERSSTGTGAPPGNLFFSPTAQAVSQRDSTQNLNRNSSYMPSGYYASPSAQAAGGNSNIAIGGNLAPGSYGNTNRYSATSGPSPPASPGLPPQTRSSYRQSASRDSMGLRAQSRDGLRAQSRDGLRAPSSRDGLGSNRNSAYLYAQPSSSSLMVGGQSVSDLTTAPNSRAPSAYLEELFDNHGSGPRERFQ